jgi:uroporphyrin-III C-methyltransferase/precorrin-2 dehydrogenase/sirohydrochlorin ferrochelatase
MQIVARQPSERKPAAMGRLAVLPVFLSLEGRRAIVIGGTAATSWKAELLAAAGARVIVYAPIMERSPELIALAATVELVDSHWSSADLRDAAIIVADAVDTQQGEAIAAAARAAGVPVNVIDRPTLSQFQFGSIVNRSPVVIGISTAGASPVLAQAIRQRLESMLPASLAAWAALALRLRQSVQAKLPSKAARRAFWDRLASLSFGPAPKAGTESQLLSQLAQPVRAGRVILVGAGPGDAELLTLKALRALQSADVILFDDLVSDDVLELARREARRLLVGKRGGRESCRQEDINDTMVKLAKAGKTVVRLKSGDPMIFGRGGEEIARLRAEGIEIDIVPGVTSALAMAARLGVSLTHRDHAQAVRFVTGHARDGRLPATLDWRSLADPTTTTIYYMAGSMAGQIGTQLMDQGMPPETPVAIAASLTRADEATMMSTLHQLAGFERQAMGNGPVLIGIGTAFAAALADGLQAGLAGSSPSVANSFGIRLMSQATAMPMTVSTKR